MCEDECDALYALALSAERSNPQTAQLLLAELERAELHKPETLPPNTVVMNAHIDFIDEASSTRRTVQLVYPQDADIAAGRVSILTPIGAGLIGMTSGASIFWPDRNGQGRTLRIVGVTSPASPEG
jgi:regulator of nucleoside diphosphate kinase